MDYRAGEYCAMELLSAAQEGLGTEHWFRAADDIKTVEDAKFVLLAMTSYFGWLAFRHTEASGKSRETILREVADAMLPPPRGE